MTEETLSNLLKEDRRFEPPADLAENANLKEEAYERAAADREGFWAEQAERLTWEQKWDRVLDWDDAAVREVVRGRAAQRGVQLRRPARRGRQRRPGGAALGG